MPQKQNRRHFARIVGWGLAGLLVLLVIAVVVAAIMPWNFLKGPITDRVESATGRELEIRGDISFNILPRPHLVLEELAFANADWAEAADMATVRRLEITPSLSSLVRGEAVIDDLEITEPVVNLQGRDQQPGNWVLPAMAPSEEDGTTADGAGAEEAGEPGPPVVVRGIDISDGRVSYLPPGAEAPHVLSLSTVAVSGNHVSVQGEASLGAGDQATNPSFELEGNLEPGYSDNHWAMNELDARVLDTQVRGSVGIDLGGDTPSVNADLHAPSVNVPEIQAQLPESPTDDPMELAVPVLPDLTGAIQLTVDEIILQGVTLTDAEARIQPGEQTLTLEVLRFEVAEGQVEATGRLVSTEQTITAEAHGQLQALDLHALGTGDRPGHMVAAEVGLTLGEIEQAPALDPRTLLQNIDIRVARGAYRTVGHEPEDATDLELILDVDGDPPAPVLTVSGDFQDTPLELDVEGAPMGELANGLAGYPLQAHARSNELQAWADTRLGALMDPSAFAGDLVLDGDSEANLEQWIGPVLPPLPEFRVAGRLSRDHDRWSVTGLDGTIGATGVTGEVHYTHGDQPVVNVDLEADRIELAQFLEEDGNTGNGDVQDNDNGESPLSALQAFDGDLDLTVATLVLPNDLELAQLRASAVLEGGHLQVGQLRFDVAGGTWASSADVDAASQPATGTVQAEFDGIALSRFGETFTEVEDRLGTLSGALNLDIAGTLPADRRDDVLLPFIGQFHFQPSELRFRDNEAGTDITLSLETEGRGGAEQTFRIDGQGEYDGSPFTLRFRGDPLLDARDPDRPYGLELTGEVVDTRIRVDGTILQPLALKGLDLGLALEGPDPQRLSRLLGVPLPELPPYSVSGDLSLGDQRWIFSDITGEAGDSDLGGRVVLETGERPPHIDAELSSSSLDIKDLGGLVGADPDEPADEAEQEAPADSPGDDRVLPAEPRVTEAWRNLSADVRYRADSVRAADVPLSNVEIDFELEDGHARFDPVRFGVGNGRVDFDLDLDSRTEPPEGTLQLEVRGVDLREALRNWALADDSVGTVGAQGKFWLTGRSVAELLGAADGGLVLLMSEGRLDALLVELAGLDASQAFLSWLRGRDPIPINCTYADLQTRDGVAHIDTLAIDTDDTTFTGTGTVNMATEELDITINAQPKDLSVLSGRTPFHLGGTFGDIQPGINEAGLASRLGGSAVLAAIAGPVAALLPLMDLGTGDDVPYCDGLAERSREAIGDNPDSNEETRDDET